jgi:hypothetical protein
MLLALSKQIILDRLAVLQLRLCGQPLGELVLVEGARRVVGGLLEHPLLVGGGQAVGVASEQVGRCRGGGGGLLLVVELLVLLVLLLALLGGHQLGGQLGADQLLLLVAGESLRLLNHHVCIGRLWWLFFGGLRGAPVREPLAVVGRARSLEWLLLLLLLLVFGLVRAQLVRLSHQFVEQLVALRLACCVSLTCVAVRLLLLLPLLLLLRFDRLPQ